MRNVDRIYRHTCMYIYTHTYIFPLRSLALSLKRQIELLLSYWSQGNWTSKIKTRLTFSVLKVIVFRQRLLHKYFGKLKMEKSLSSICQTPALPLSVKWQEYFLWMERLQDLCFTLWSDQSLQPHHLQGYCTGSHTTKILLACSPLHFWLSDLWITLSFSEYANKTATPWLRRGHTCCMTAILRRFCISWIFKCKLGYIHFQAKTVLI